MRKICLSKFFPKTKQINPDRGILYQDLLYLFSLLITDFFHKFDINDYKEGNHKGCPYKNHQPSTINHDTDKNSAKRVSKFQSHKINERSIKKVILRMDNGQLIVGS